MHKDTKIRVDITFRDNLMKAFPNRPMRERTKQLNKMLEEIIYGKKKI